MMSHGKGSVEKRDNDGYTWKLVICAGYNSHGDKLRQTKTIHVEGRTTESRRKAAERELALFLAEVDRGEVQSRQKLSDFIERWLKEQQLEAKTMLRYEQVLMGRVVRNLGHLKMEQIKPLHLLDFYNTLRQPGERENTKYKATCELPKDIIGIHRRTLASIKAGNATTKVVALQICAAIEKKLDKVFTPVDTKPLSERTVLQHHLILSTMFTDAVRWGLMRENPCSKVAPPKIENKKEMRSLDEVGLLRMLQCIENEPIKLQAMIMLPLVTGCRRGEIAGLEWGHLTGGNVSIRQAASYTPKKGIFIKRPKNESSVREIAIPASVVLLMKQYKRWQTEQRLKVGDQWIVNDWVFATWDGHIMHPDSFSSAFKDFIKRHNLPDLRLHDLRHTACTMLLHKGLNVKAVAARMGHANANVTLTVYAHALRSADQMAADMMEEIVSKSALVPQ